jgi:hypothetical protein
MEIFVFFLLVAFVLILFGAGTALIWYGTILLKDKDSFLTFCGILLIIFGASFVLIGVGTVACLLTIG